MANFDLRKLGTGENFIKTNNTQQRQVPPQTLQFPSWVFNSNEPQNYNEYAAIEEDFMASQEAIGVPSQSFVTPGGTDYSNLHTGLGETSAEVRAQIDDEMTILAGQQEEMAAIQNGEDSAIKTLKEKAEEKNQEYLDKVEESDEELADEIKSLQDSNKEIVEKLNENGQQLQEKESSLSSVEVDLSNSKQSKADLESQISGAQGSISDDMTAEEKSAIQSQISQMKNALATVEAEIQAKQEQITKIEAEIAEIKDQKTKLEEERTKVATQLFEAEQKAMELDESVVQIKEEAEQAEADVYETTVALTQQKQADIEETQARIQTLEQIAMEKQQEEAKKAQEERRKKDVGSGKVQDVDSVGQGANPYEYYSFEDGQIYEAPKENAPEVLPQYQATVNELSDERDMLIEEKDKISFFDRLLSKEKRDEYERLEHKILFTEFQIESYMPKG